MKNLYFVLPMILLISLIVSCKKEKIEFVEKKNSPQADFVLRDGRVVFESNASFQSTLKKIFIEQDNELVLQNVIPNFISIAEVYEQNLLIIDTLNAFTDAVFQNLKGVHLINEQENDLRFDRMVDALLLSYVVNENGEFQIGDTVYKMNYEKIVWCSEAFFNANSNDIASLINSNSSEVVVHTIERFEEEISGPRTVTDDECFSYMSSDGMGGGIVSRLRGRMRHTEAVVYREIKLISAHELYTDGAYKLSPAEELVVDGTGYFHYTLGGVSQTDPYDVYKIEYDKKECNKVVFYYAGLGGYTSVGFSPSCNNLHSVIRFTGSSLFTCNTSY